MEYLPTFALECGHFSPNVGKYSLHGASGIGKDTESHGFRVFAKKKWKKSGVNHFETKNHPCFDFVAFCSTKIVFFKISSWWFQPI